MNVRIVMQIMSRHTTRALHSLSPCRMAGKRLRSELLGSFVGLGLYCSGQQKLATALEFFQYRFSDSFGGNPPLYSCGLSAL
ncbi:hypothetical protein D3G36_18520 [Escherichia coli]|uniref:Uncharacterized protein n=1 Tax=Escherichia coli TaxID=562 RepID=A0A826J4M1_ECOLX|nr:hypothetical protein [Escherichia coli]